jgi:hypothetical protein
MREKFVSGRLHCYARIVPNRLSSALAIERMKVPGHLPTDSTDNVPRAAMTQAAVYGA